MKDKGIMIKVIAVFLLIASVAVVFLVNGIVENDKLSSCDDRRWEDHGEYMNCKYPYPPIGRWHAVYTKEFAEKYNLPTENISTDLSSGVNYMEIDVQPYGTDLAGTACLVNMLIKKPHDVSFLKWTYDGLPNLPKDRKLLHLVDLDQYQHKLKSIGSFSSASRDHLPDKRGYRQSTFAIYAENVLPGYDYISANKHCRNISMHPQSFPDGYAFWVNKASVWGRYEPRFKHMDEPGRPHGKEFFESHFFINIPRELISEIFKDVPVGGQ